MPDADDLTTAEAAAELHITADAVRQAIKRGHLASTKRGRDRFITRAEVERYAVARHVRQPRTPQTE